MISSLDRQTESKKGVLFRLLGLLLPWLILLASLSATWMLWNGAQEQARRELQAEFDYNVQAAIRDVETRMEAYKLLLHGLQGLFSSSAEVSRNEFRAYVESLDIKTRFPGILGVGYSMIVPQEDRAAHEDEMRRQGFPDYAIRPAGQRDPVTTIVYIEPQAGSNLRALGFDMLSDPVRRAAMERAGTQNKAALTGKLVLQQDAGDGAHPGFVMFLPILGSACPSDRAPTVTGWVHAHFRADDLMAVMTARHQQKIGLAIYDGTEISEQNLLSATAGFAAAGDARASAPRVTRQIMVAGHPWTIETRALPGLEARFDRTRPRVILFGGIGISLLLALVIQMLIQGRAQALRLAREMNSALITSEFRWKYALEGAGEGVWDWDISTDQMFLGPRLHAMLGYAEDELGNDFSAWERLLHQDDRNAVIEALDAYLEDRSPKYEAEARLRGKGGEWKWILMRGIVVSRDAQGKPLRMIGTHADITERHMKDETLKLWSTVFQTVKEGVLVTDAERRIVAVNPTFTDITGYIFEEVAGKSPLLLTDGNHKPGVLEGIEHSLSTTDAWTGEIVCRHKSGALYIAWVSLTRVRNVKGEVTNFVATFSDVSERKATEKRMQHLAHYDLLTDLPNRALFTDRMQQALALARRNNARSALLFIDLDKFKPVNDTLGHNVGDLLLKEVAYRLLDCIRESDTAARLGGDEFVVLLSTIEAAKDALSVGEKILQAIEQPFELGEHRVGISASIGVAVYPDHGHNDEKLIKNADEAMYYAKHHGGGKVVAFDQLWTTPSADSGKP